MEWVVTEKDFDSLETDFAEEFSRYDHYSDVRLHEHIYKYNIYIYRSQYGDMLHDTERVRYIALHFLLMTYIYSIALKYRIRNMSKDSDGPLIICYQKGLSLECWT